MHAVVLVGGFGTRLRPLTYSIPKPLLPIAHTAMVERLLNSLARGGVTDAVLALGFKPEPFYSAFPNSMCGSVKLTYAVEDTPLDTAGAIGFAARVAGINDTFVVANGDVITDLDVASLIAFHRSHGSEGTISLTPVEDPSQFGIVETDSSGKVLRFVEKPQPGESPSRNASAGTYVFEAAVLERMPSDVRLSIERLVFPEMVRDGKLFAMATNDYWIDAGRPDTYIEANIHVAQALACSGDAPVHATAEVAENVRIADSVIGFGARIGPGAVVERSVLLPGAVIGAGAIVEGSLVMGAVGSNAKIIGCIVGEDGEVPEGSQSFDLKFPPDVIATS